jgi:hypothetical protein
MRESLGLEWTLSMSGKGNANRRYRVHGDGVDTIRNGFAELAMPEHRRPEALAIVREVLGANDAINFRWYKPDGTNELACYWGDHPYNVLWVTASEVHIPSDTSRVRRPKRSVDWQKEEGAYVGWLLPGAERGTGGGPRNSEVETVLCPDTYIRQPAGTLCPRCDVVHS